MASKGYPRSYEKGCLLEIPDDLKNVYVAGARKGDDGRLYSDGGRVLGVTERGSSISEAIDKAYASVKRITFTNGFYRKDIGARALKALED